MSNEIKIGYGTINPTADVEIIGVVSEFAGFADVLDAEGEPLQNALLLKFVGKRVRIRIDEVIA